MKRFKPGTLVRFVKKQNNDLPRILREGKDWKDLRGKEDRIGLWKYVKYNSLCLVIQPSYKWVERKDESFKECIILVDGTFLIAWNEDLREVKKRK